MARRKVVLISIVTPSQFDVNMRFKHGRRLQIKQIRPYTDTGLKLVSSSFASPFSLSVSLLAALHTSWIYGWWGNERKRRAPILSFGCGCLKIACPHRQPAIPRCYSQTHAQGPPFFIHPLCLSPVLHFGSPSNFSLRITVNLIIPLRFQYSYYYSSSTADNTTRLNLRWRFALYPITEFA